MLLNTVKTLIREIDLNRKGMFGAWNQRKWPSSFAKNQFVELTNF